MKNSSPVLGRRSPNRMSKSLNLYLLIANGTSHVLTAIRFHNSVLYRLLLFSSFNGLTTEDLAHTFASLIRVNPGDDPISLFQRLLRHSSEIFAGAEAKESGTHPESLKTFASSATALVSCRTLNTPDTAGCTNATSSPLITS